MISSVANPTVRRVRRLRKSSWRERTGRFLVEGHRAVEGALDAGAALDEIFLTPRGETARAAILERARAAGIKTTIVAPAIMEHWTGLPGAPDALAVAPLREARDLRGVTPPAIVLSAVHDPATAGGIMATAVGVGMRTIFAAPRTADVFEQKAVRAGQGAHFFASVFRGVRLEESVASLRAAGGHVVVAAEKGAPPWELELPPALVLVVDGDETCGLSAERVALPSERLVPSLSTRVGVVLYEWVRQSGAASR